MVPVSLEVVPAGGIARTSAARQSGKSAETQLRNGEGTEGTNAGTTHAACRNITINVGIPTGLYVHRVEVKQVRVDTIPAPPSPIGFQNMG